MKRVKVSNNVIRRLPRYLQKLDELGESGVDRISSGELGRQMNLTPSQIRQDFSCFGEFGQQGSQKFWAWIGTSPLYWWAWATSVTR